MKCLWLLLISSVIFSAGRAAANDNHNIHGRFVAKDGRAISFDAHDRSFTAPYGTSTSLANCSNAFQTCLKDGRGFAFAFFNHCDGWGTLPYKGLSFVPSVIFALENDVWVVFDESPRFMFHYSFANGLVGIYLRNEPGFDFRRLLQDKKASLAELDSDEFVLAGKEHVAVCSIPSQDKTAR
jgi:hypothetical protein